MISTQVHLVLGTIKGHSKNVLREQQIGMHTAGMSTRAVARELNLSPIRRLTTAELWSCVDDWFADVNVVNRVSQGGDGVIV